MRRLRRLRRKPVDAVESMSLALRAALEGDQQTAAAHYERARQANNRGGIDPEVEADIAALLDRTPHDTTAAPADPSANLGDIARGETAYHLDKDAEQDPPSADQTVDTTRATEADTVGPAAQEPYRQASTQEPNTESTRPSADTDDERWGTTAPQRSTKRTARSWS